MTLLGGDVLTLAEMAKRTEDGMPAMIAEVLDEEKGVLSDIPWKASNLPTSNISTRRVGLPTVYLRKLNSGSVSSRSTTTQVTDGMAMADAWSTVDKKLLSIMGNPSAYRVGEGRSFIEAMGQTVEGLAWYGSVADDEKECNGLFIRPEFASLGTQCISGGSTTASSIVLINWHPEKICGLYPKHLKGGLQHEDHGEQVLQESTTMGGSKMAVFMDQWSWDFGFMVKDPRNAVRICNVDVPEVLGASGFQEITDYTTNAIQLMARATHRIPQGAGKKVFYMNRGMFEALDVQTQIRTGSNAFKVEDVQGQKVTTFRGIPIKISEQLLYAEATVS